ncbi:MAG: sulfatase-like hydrolase/transferase, partial [Bacteroidaceae bacterium]|nr:sulfatase-like hydrolase/transferase [Bacteroidaceae bacterium]
MKRSIHYLEYIYCHLLVCFLIGRVAFILNNRVLGSVSLADAAGACWRGFVNHDLMVAAFLLVVPWLMGLVAVRRPSLRLRAWLIPYYIVMGFFMALVTAADAVLYEFWQFKLGVMVLNYASSPEGTTNSVSFAYILIRVALFLAFALLITIPCILFTPKRLTGNTSERLWLRNISIIWCFLLVSGVCFMRQGDAYGDPKTSTPMVNHAAVNPVYAFFRSLRLDRKYFNRANLLTEKERASLFEGLYPEPADDIQDTLLVSQRPDILIVFIEGFGARFIKELGGLPDVAPGWSRFIPEGIFWENYYSNSFRTDRGTVCAFSGWLSFTDVGLMKKTELYPYLPSLARSLGKAGYETGYIYGGSMSNMGKGVYLENMDFQHLYSEKDFPAEQKGSGWGVPDSIVLQRACQIVGQW